MCSSYDYLYEIYRDTYENKNSEINVFPLYFVYDYIEPTKSKYLVHFTTNLDFLKNILKNGFMGVEQYQFLGNTQIGALYDSTYSEDGFVFAYEIEDSSYNMESPIGLFFKTESIQVYHEADGEYQQIFIANEIDKNSMIGFNCKNGICKTLDGKVEADSVYELAVKLNIYN